MRAFVICEIVAVFVGFALGMWLQLRTWKPWRRECKECDGTGVIETGNNDLPCRCPAGDRALFNVAGHDGPVLGKDLRRGDRDPLN